MNTPRLFQTFSAKAKSARHRVPLWANVDGDLLMIWGMICAIGLVMVATASIAVAEKTHSQPFFFIEKQVVFFVIGSFLGLLCLQVPLAFWEKTGLLWVCLAMVVLVAVLIPGIGRTVNGSTRWIPFGPINIQVSELVKLLLAIYLAGYLVRRRATVRTSFRGYIIPAMILAVASALLMMQPDFGATAVVFVTCLGLLFIGGGRLREFLALFICGGGFLSVMVVTSPYRMARLTNFRNPWADPFNSGFQLTQSLIAIGRGELFGVGLGESVQKLFYLPEAHTDFIFAVLAEELGLVGVLVLILLFGALMYKMLRIGMAAEAQDKWFGAYLIYGIALLIGLSALLNMGVVMGLFPTKGLALPFISYGGSNLIVNCMAFGLVLRVNYEVRRGEVQARKVNKR